MRPDERIAMKLRILYEKRGFKRVQPGKFEEHALYIANKNFLQSDQIISFMDMDGKLLALKPDVTLSIVKNVPAGPLPGFRKLYYLDEVYRASRESREYKAHKQIGVELLGPPDAFASIEVVDLALVSLEAIAEDYVLDVSHLGFVTGLLNGLELSPAAARRIFRAIHRKSGHEMNGVLDAENISEPDKNRLLRLVALHGKMEDALAEAESLIGSDEMRQAYNELVTLSGALQYNGFSGRINLDFSVVNDLDYYNGLIFQGYVAGVPHSVLTGGRYDNLMHKMGKSSGAAGFAVSIDDLNTYIRTGRPYDFDLVITYGEQCSWPALLRTVKELTDSGTSVRLEREGADLDSLDFTWRRRGRFQGETLLEEGGSH